MIVATALSTKDPKAQALAVRLIERSPMPKADDPIYSEDHVLAIRRKLELMAKRMRENHKENWSPDKDD